MENVNVKVRYCRLCGIKCTKAVNVFSGKGHGMGLKDKILKCLLITVRKCDQLPTRVCYTCIDRLDELNQFHLLARQAQVKLKAILKSQGVHVKEEKNSEILTTWTALMAQQEMRAMKAKKHKRRSEIRLDSSSDSTTSDSSSDSDSSSEGQSAILPKFHAVEGEKWSSPDTSANYVNQANISDSSEISSKTNQSTQEGKFVSSTAGASVSGISKSGYHIQITTEKSQMMTENDMSVSQDVMMTYQQPVTNSVSNNFIPATSSQSLIIPSQIPNSMLVINGTNFQSPSVRIPPVYVLNVACNSSENGSDISQIRMSCDDISRRESTVVSIGQSYPSPLPSNTSSVTQFTRASEQNPSVSTSASISLINELSPLLVDNSDVPPPLTRIDDCFSSNRQKSGNLRKESQTDKSSGTSLVVQNHLSDPDCSEQLTPQGPSKSPSSLPSNVKPSTGRNAKACKNVEHEKDSENSNSGILGLSDKPVACGLNNHFSDISDVEEDPVEFQKDVVSDRISPLDNPQRVAEELLSTKSVPPVTFRIVPKDALNSSYKHPLVNLEVIPHKVNSNHSPSSKGQFNTTEHKDSSEQVTSKQDNSLNVKSDNVEKCLEIVSEAESDDLPLQVLVKNLVPNSKNHSGTSVVTTEESDVEEVSTESSLLGISGNPRKLNFFSGKNTSLPSKPAESSHSHDSPKTDPEESSELANGKDVIISKEVLSRKKPPILLHKSVQSGLCPQKPANREQNKFKCELCSKDNPTFFASITGAMYHHQLRHAGSNCMFSCSKCSYVTGHMQNLRQHILASCFVHKAATTSKEDENIIPKVKEEDSQDYEQALLNLKNALRSVSMPRFRRLLTSCKAVLSPEESKKQVSMSIASSPSTSGNVNMEDGDKSSSDCDVLQKKCSFCLRYINSADLLDHVKYCHSTQSQEGHLNSPPAKKIKPMDVFSSQLFSREGSSYVCVHCGKKLPSMFKAKMHATRSKLCKNSTLIKSTETRPKLPEFNLPSSFRSDYNKRVQDAKNSASGSASARESLVQSESSSNSENMMVFDIPPIKVEKEDVEVTNTEAQLMAAECGDNSTSDGKSGDLLVETRVAVSGKGDKPTGSDKELGNGKDDESSLHSSAGQGEESISNSNVNGEFELEKVKVEESPDMSNDSSYVENNVNFKNVDSDIRIKSKKSLKRRRNCLDKSDSSSEDNLNAGFQVRHFAAPFQVVQPMSLQEIKKAVSVKSKVAAAKKSSCNSMFNIIVRKSPVTKSGIQCSEISVNNVSGTVSTKSSVQDTSETSPCTQKILNTSSDTIHSVSTKPPVQDSKIKSESPPSTQTVLKTPSQPVLPVFTKPPVQVAKRKSESPPSTQTVLTTSSQLLLPVFTKSPVQVAKRKSESPPSTQTVLETPSQPVLPVFTKPPVQVAKRKSESPSSTQAVLTTSSQPVLPVFTKSPVQVAKRKSESPPSTQTVLETPSQPVLPVFTKSPVQVAKRKSESPPSTQTVLETPSQPVLPVFTKPPVQVAKRKSESPPSTQAVLTTSQPVLPVFTKSPVQVAKRKSESPPSTQTVLETSSQPVLPVFTKPPVQVAKSKPEKPHSTETVFKTSFRPILPKLSSGDSAASPSKQWLKDVEKLCGMTTQSSDPNRGLVLKVPFIKLKRLQLLSNGEVDISGVEISKEMHQPSNSSSKPSKHNDGLQNASEGNRLLIPKKEPVTNDSNVDESIFGW